MKFLIAGLGNIGADYVNTRHNIGFDILDALAAKAGASFVSDRLAFKAEVKHKGRSFHLIKPTTYMNLSGKSVRYWLQQLKITPDHLLVVVDDVALPFCKLRLRPKGSDAGHNGLKDIQEALGTTTYPRLRFGIGDDFPRGAQVHFVLGEWTKDEQAALPLAIDKACDAILSFGTIGLTRTMNEFN